MADIFILYKREDRDSAERLSHALEQLGFDVWWDFDLLTGDRYRKVIREVIDKCRAAIVLWSGKSVESDFVLDEASHAKNRGKLCPARIEEVDLPFGFGQMHTDDLISWDGELTHAGFQGLVRSLETRTERKARLGKPTRSAESQTIKAELETFQAAQLAVNVAALRAFLNQHPRGSFAGFVRRQIETMDTPAPRAEVVEPAVPEPPPQEQPRVEPSSPPSIPQPAKAQTSRPWPKLAGVAIVVVGISGLVMLHNAQEDTRRAQADLKAQQESLKQERKTRESAESRAKDFEAKERTSREQVERERIAAQQAEQQRVAREKAEREKAEREVERQRLATVQAEQQRLAREKADREARERAAAEAKAKAAAQPAPYDLGQLHAAVRAAVERARDAEKRANAVAVRAREAAAKGRASGVSWPKSGLGIANTWPSEKTAGDEYAGYFENARLSGLGVYSYARNASNTDNISLRYEGERTNGKRNGLGVYIRNGGSRLAGTFRDGSASGPAVNHFSNGDRYEGEYANNTTNGYGVRWNAQGRVLEAGIWADGKLTSPLGRQGR